MIQDSSFLNSNRRAISYLLFFSSLPPGYSALEKTALKIIMLLGVKQLRNLTNVRGDETIEERSVSDTIQSVCLITEFL